MPQKSNGRFVKFVLFLLSVGQLAACREPIAQDLVGTWHVDYGNSQLALKLNQDGTFEEIFQNKGETNSVRRIGKWELTEFEGPSVLLKGALFVEDQTGAIDSKLSASNNGEWILHVNQTLGHLSLTVSEDLGLYFERDRQR